MAVLIQAQRSIELYHKSTLKDLQRIPLLKPKFTYRMSGKTHLQLSVFNYERFSVETTAEVKI